MKWNKLTVRELTKEEQEEYGDLYNFMWDGPIPELGEEVLVTVPLSSGKFINTYTDAWIEFDNGVGFEYTDNDVIYWMEMPQYNRELEN